MTRYVTIRMTRAQAQAASNACDLIADSLRADGDKREASLYERASATLDQIRPDNTRGQRYPLARRQRRRPRAPGPHCAAAATWSSA